MRHLSTWLGWDDLLHFAERCIEAPDVGFLQIYGVSANTRSYWRNDQSARLGYVPQQNAEDFAAEILAKPVPDPRDDVARRFQGGVFVSMDYTPDAQRPR